MYGDEEEVESRESGDHTYGWRGGLRPVWTLLYYRYSSFGSLT